MNFFKFFLTLFFLFFITISYADNHSTDLSDGVKEIDDDFLNDPTNFFQRIFHERKPGYVNLKIDGWYTKRQIIDNYEMLIKELNINYNFYLRNWDSNAFPHATKGFFKFKKNIPDLIDLAHI